MSNILTKSLSASEAHNLRRTFEAAIAQIQRGENVAIRRLQSSYADKI
jgi:hypothetical protein